MATGDTLTNGAGFSGATAVSSVGTTGDPGFDCTPIDKWLDVPWKVRGSDFKLGVAAFHINGIN